MTLPHRAGTSRGTIKFYGMLAFIQVMQDSLIRLKEFSISWYHRGWREKGLYKMIDPSMDLFAYTVKELASLFLSNSTDYR